MSVHILGRTKVGIILFKVIIRILFRIILVSTSNDAHTGSWPHKCSKAEYFLLIPHIILSKEIERPDFLSKFVIVQFPFELRHLKVSTDHCPCDIFAAAQWEADWKRELLGIGTTLKRGWGLVQFLATRHPKGRVCNICEIKMLSEISSRAAAPSTKVNI